MTECKTAAGGTAEVSAKFVHEAAADEAISALWQEHERLRQQYSEAIEESDRTFIAKQDITETETPEFDAADAAHEAADQHRQETSDATVATENRMAEVPARTVAGVLLKLRIAGAEITDEIRRRDGTLDETLLENGELLTLSALADLERLAAPNEILAAAVAEDGTNRLAALLDEHTRASNLLCDATEAKEAAEGPERELLKDKEDEADAREREAWETFLQTPCRTIAEVLFKLHAVHERLKEHAFSLRTEDLFKGAMSDYGRLIAEGAPIVEPSVIKAPAATMTKNPVDDALLGLADSLSMVDSARHALGTVLEDMGGHPGENIGFCILRTLDGAAEQGQDSLKIIEEAVKEKAA